MILELDFNSASPIYQQIVDQIILGLYRGDLEASEELPAIRALAQDIGVNFMTVSKAYQILKDLGLLVSDRSKGSRIADQIDLKESQTQLQKDLALNLAKLSLLGLSQEEILELVHKILKEGV